MDLTSSVFQQAITKFTLTKALEMSVQLSNEAPKGVRNFKFSLLKNAQLKKKNHFLLIGGLVNKKKKNHIRNSLLQTFLDQHRNCSLS